MRKVSAAGLDPAAVKRLQWGRNMRVAESDLCGIDTEEAAGFNGAAT